MRNPRASRSRRRPLVEQLDDRCLLSAGPAAAPIGGMPHIPVAGHVNRFALARGGPAPSDPTPEVAAARASRVFSTTPRLARTAFRPAFRPTTPAVRPAFRLARPMPQVAPSAPQVLPPVVPAAAPPMSPEASAWADRIVALTNEQRLLNGSPPVVADARLMQMAGIQAQQMAEFERMEHRLPEARYPDLASRASAAGYRYAKVGENIAFNYPDPDATVRAWMQSEAHRRNLLDPGHTQIGVSMARSGSGRPYVAQVLGRPA